MAVERVEVNVDMEIQEHLDSARMKKRLQISLGGVFGFMTFVCILLGMHAMRTSEREVTFRCGSMPPNDHALIAWLQRNEGTRDVRVSRNDNTVTTHIRNRGFRVSTEIALPPLESLGYVDAQFQGMSSMIATPAPVQAIFRWIWRNYWIVAAGVASLLLAIYVVSPRLRKSPNVDTGPATPQRLP